MFKISFSILLLFIAATKAEIQCPSTETLLNGHCQPIVADLYCSQEKCSENMICNDLNQCTCLEGFFEYSDLDDGMKKKCASLEALPKIAVSTDQLQAATSRSAAVDSSDHMTNTDTTQSTNSSQLYSASTQSNVESDFYRSLTDVSGKKSQSLQEASGNSKEDSGEKHTDVSQNGYFVSSGSAMPPNSGDYNDSRKELNSTEEVDLRDPNQISAINPPEIQSTITNHAMSKNAVSNDHPETSRSADDLTTESTQSIISTDLLYSTTDFYTLLNSSESNGRDGVESNHFTEVANEANERYIQDNQKHPPERNSSGNKLDFSEDVNSSTTADSSSQPMEDFQNNGEETSANQASSPADINIISKEYPKIEDIASTLIPDDITNTDTTQLTISTEHSSPSTASSDSSQLYSASTQSNVETDFLSSPTDFSGKKSQSLLEASGNSHEDSGEENTDDSDSTMPLNNGDYNDSRKELNSREEVDLRDPNQISATDPPEIQSTIKNRALSKNAVSKDHPANSRSADDLTTDTTQSNFSTDLLSSTTDSYTLLNSGESNGRDGIESAISSHDTETVESKRAYNSAGNQFSERYVETPKHSNTEGNPESISEESTVDLFMENHNTPTLSTTTLTETKVTDTVIPNEETHLLTSTTLSTDDYRSLLSNHSTEVANEANDRYMGLENNNDNDSPTFDVFRTPTKASANVASTTEYTSTSNDELWNPVSTTLATTDPDLEDNQKHPSETNSSENKEVFSESVYSSTTADSSSQPMEDSQSNGEETSTNQVEASDKNENLNPKYSNSDDSTTIEPPRSSPEENEEIFSSSAETTTTDSVEPSEETATNSATEKAVDASVVGEVTYLTTNNDSNGGTISPANINITSKEYPKIEDNASTLIPDDMTNTDTTQSTVSTELSSSSTDFSDSSQHFAATTQSNVETDFFSSPTDVSEKMSQSLQEASGNSHEDSGEENIDVSENGGFVSSDSTMLTNNDDYNGTRKELNSRVEVDLRDPTQISATNPPEIQSTIKNRTLSKNAVSKDHPETSRSADDLTTDTTQSTISTDLLSSTTDSYTLLNSSESNGRDGIESAISSHDTETVEYTRANNYAGNQFSERYIDTPKHSNTEANPESISEEGTVDLFVENQNTPTLSTTTLTETKVTDTIIPNINDEETHLPTSNTLSTNDYRSLLSNHSAEVANEANERYIVLENNNDDYSPTSAVFLTPTDASTHGTSTTEYTSASTDELRNSISTTLSTTDSDLDENQKHPSETNSSENKVYFSGDVYSSTTADSSSQPMEDSQSNGEGTSANEVQASIKNEEKFTLNLNPKYSNNDDSTTFEPTRSTPEENEEIYSSTAATTTDSVEPSAKLTEGLNGSVREVLQPIVNSDLEEIVTNSATEKAVNASVAGEVTYLTTNYDSNGGTISAINIKESTEYESTSPADIDIISKEYPKIEDNASTLIPELDDNGSRREDSSQNLTSHNLIEDPNQILGPMANKRNASETSSKIKEIEISMSREEREHIDKVGSAIQKTSSTDKSNNNNLRREETPVSRVDVTNIASAISRTKYKDGASATTEMEDESSRSSLEEQTTTSKTEAESKLVEGKTNSKSRINANTDSQRDEKSNNLEAHTSVDTWTPYSSSTTDNDESTIASVSSTSDGRRDNDYSSEKPTISSTTYMDDASATTEVEDESSRSSLEEQTTTSKTEAESKLVEGKTNSKSRINANTDSQRDEKSNNLEAHTSVDTWTPYSSSTADYDESTIASVSSTSDGRRENDSSTEKPTILSTTYMDDGSTTTEMDDESSRSSLEEQTTTSQAEKESNLLAGQRDGTSGIGANTDSQSDDNSNNLQPHTTGDTWTPYSSSTADYDESTIASVSSTSDGSRENDSSTEKPIKNEEKFTQNFNPKYSNNDDSTTFEPTRSTPEENEEIYSSTAATTTATTDSVEPSAKLIEDLSDSVSEVLLPIVNSDLEEIVTNSATEKGVNDRVGGEVTYQTTNYDSNGGTTSAINIKESTEYESTSPADIDIISKEYPKIEDNSSTLIPELDDNGSRREDSSQNLTSHNLIEDPNQISGPMANKRNASETSSKIKEIEISMSREEREHIDKVGSAIQKTSSTDKRNTNSLKREEIPVSTVDVTNIASAISRTKYKDGASATTEMEDESRRSSLEEKTTTSKTEAESKLVEGKTNSKSKINANTDSQRDEKLNNLEAHTSLDTWTPYSSSTTDNDESPIASVSSTSDGRRENDYSSEKPTILSTTYMDDGSTATEMDDESRRSSLEEQTTTSQAEKESKLVAGQRDGTSGIGANTDSQSDEKSNYLQAHTTVDTRTTYSSPTTDNDESTIASVSSTSNGRRENYYSTEKPTISSTTYMDDASATTEVEDESSRSSLEEQTTTSQAEKESKLVDSTSTDSQSDDNSNNLQPHTTVDTWTPYSSSTADYDESTIASVSSTSDGRRENDSSTEKPTILSTTYMDDGSTATEMDDESRRSSLEEQTTNSTTETESKLVAGQRDGTSGIGANTDSQSDEKSNYLQAHTTVDTRTTYSSPTTDNDESTIASVSSTSNGRRENYYSTEKPTISSTTYMDDASATTEMEYESGRSSLEEQTTTSKTETESKLVAGQRDGTSGIGANTDSQSDEKSNNLQAHTTVHTRTTYSSSTTDNDESTISFVSSTFDDRREHDSSSEKPTIFSTTYMDDGSTITEMDDESSRSSLEEQTTTSKTETESKLVDSTSTDNQSDEKSNNIQAHTTIDTWTPYSSWTTNNDESTIASVSNTFDGRPEIDSSSEKTAISTTKYDASATTELEDDSSRSSIEEQTTTSKTETESKLVEGKTNITSRFSANTDSQSDEKSNNLQAHTTADTRTTYSSPTTDNDESTIASVSSTFDGRREHDSSSEKPATSSPKYKDDHSTTTEMEDESSRSLLEDGRRPQKVVTANYSTSKDSSSLPMGNEVESSAEEKLLNSNDIGNHIISKNADVTPKENRDDGLSTEINVDLTADTRTEVSSKSNVKTETENTTNVEAKVDDSSLASTLTNSSKSAKVIPESADERAEVPDQVELGTWSSTTTATKYNSEESDAVSEDTTTQPSNSSQLTTTKPKSTGNSSTNSDEEDIKQASSDIIKHRPDGVAPNGTKTASPNSRLATILLTNITTFRPKNRRRPIVNIPSTTAATTLHPNLNQSVLITEDGNILLDHCLNTNDKCSKICCGNNTICSVNNGCLCLEGFTQRVQKSNKGIYCVPVDEVTVAARAPLYYIVIGVGCLAFAIGYFSVRYFHLLRIGGRNNVV